MSENETGIGEGAAKANETAPEASNAPVEPAVRGPAHRASGLVLTELAPDERSVLDVACGLLVQRVESPKGPASVQAGDIIVAVADAPFRTRAEFDRLVEQRSGEPVALLVLRSGRSQYVALVSERI